MEPINELTKRIFTNYLRDLCVKLDESSLSKIRSSVSKETPNSWCGLIPDPDLLRGALGYFLVSHKCPEYFLINTVDMTYRSVSSMSLFRMQAEECLIIRVPEKVTSSDNDFTSSSNLLLVISTVFIKKYSGHL